MFGKVASFMELGLSFSEVMDMPLRNILMMQKDKVRVAYGDVKREMTAEEEEAFFKKKINNT